MECCRAHLVFPGFPSRDWDILSGSPDGSEFKQTQPRSEKAPCGRPAKRAAKHEPQRSPGPRIPGGCQTRIRSASVGVRGKVDRCLATWPAARPQIPKRRSAADDVRIHRHLNGDSNLSKDRVGRIIFRCCPPRLAAGAGRSSSARTRSGRYGPSAAVRSSRSASTPDRGSCRHRQTRPQ